MLCPTNNWNETLSFLLKCHTTIYHSHGHGHGIFILATHSKGTWPTNPKPSFTQHPSADPTRALYACLPACLPACLSVCLPACLVCQYKQALKALQTEALLWTVHIWEVIKNSAQLVPPACICSDHDCDPPPRRRHHRADPAWSSSSLW